MSDTKDFVIENDVLKKYEGNGGDVVIPEGVTCIGRYAFNGCKDLTSVIIPEGVTSIGDRAFYKCHNLTSITIPYSLTSIVGKWSDQAFEGCINLKEVHIDSLEAWSTMDKNKWDDTPLRYTMNTAITWSTCYSPRTESTDWGCRRISTRNTTMKQYFTRRKMALGHWMKRYMSA